MRHARPNILFFFPDQQRPEWLEFNSSLDIKTPSLMRLAENGVRFANAITPSPLCAPARACLATGREYWKCRVPDNFTDLPLDMATYYQSLRDVGYRVAGVGKFDLHKNTSDPANLDWHLDGSRLLSEWGFTDGVDNEGKMDGSASFSAAGGPKGPYLKFLADRNLADAYVEEHKIASQVLGAYTTVLPDDAYCDNWIAENGKCILKAFPKDEPWHLVVNFTGPHSPMDVTPTMRESVENRSYPLPIQNTKHKADDLIRNRQNYAAMIENIDRLIGEMLDVVGEREELDNTIVVYSSDHGEMLGDFDRFGKSVWRYGSAHVPLIVAGPGMKKGVVTKALTDLTDLTATFLDFAGCKPLAEMDGRSLKALLDGRETSHREVVFSGLGPWKMVYDGRYKLVLEEGSAPRLFDLQQDIYEKVNIGDNNLEIIDLLKAHLAVKGRP